MTLHVASERPLEAILPVVVREAHALDPSIPVFQVQTMRGRMDDSLGQERLVAVLAGGISVFGALLAVVGLYGVVNYAVARRTRELAVRLALGALPRDVFSTVLQRTLLLALVGIALGLPAAFACTSAPRQFPVRHQRQRSPDAALRRRRPRSPRTRGGLPSRTSSRPRRSSDGVEARVTRPQARRTCLSKSAARSSRLSRRLKDLNRRSEDQEFRRFGLPSGSPAGSRSRTMVGPERWRCARAPMRSEPTRRGAGKRARRFSRRLRAV